jgi:hypothetical protein
MQGAIVQVNISPGGLPKRAIAEGWIAPLGIEGDLHAHPNIHGGPLKAILIVASEVVDALTARGYPLFYGALGENLTTRGIDIRRIRIGDQFRVGGARWRSRSPAARAPRSMSMVNRSSWRNLRSEGEAARFLLPTLGHERLLRQRGGARAGARGRRGIADLPTGVTMIGP